MFLTEAGVKFLQVVFTKAGHACHDLYLEGSLTSTVTVTLLANLLIFTKEVIAHWTGEVNSKSSITAASSVWGIL